MSSKKSWLQQMETPVIKISAVSSAEPVRGHSHFSKHRGQNPRARKSGVCIGTRKNHSWINGRCFWCGKPFLNK